MPDRIQPFTEILIMSLFAGSGGLIAAQGGESGLMDHEQLRAWCVVGSVMGAAVSVMFTPPKNMRVGAFKWLGSVFTSFMFTPAVFHWMGIDRSVDTVLPVSGLLAFLAWYILKGVQIIGERWVKRFLEKLLGSVID